MLQQEVADTSQVESWNMANEYMRLISNTLAAIIDCWQNPYKDGRPRFKELVSNLRTLKILASVYLDEDELKEAHDKYIKFFIEQPVVDMGHATIIPYVTEEKMYEFPEWILKKLKQKGALVPPQFDPDMAL